MVPTFKLFAPSKEELMCKNLAGITPLERFEVWVQTELGGAKAFPPANQLLRELHERVPDSSSFEGHCLANKIVLASVNVSVRSFQVAGRSVPVRVWEPPDQESVADVLWLELPFFVPLRLSEPAVHTIARAICSPMKVRIFMLSYEVVSSSALSASSFSELHKDLSAVIDTLPLKKPFLLVDNSLGETTHMLWHLQEALSGALVLNFRGFHSDDFASSELYKKVTKRFAMIAGLFKNHDVDGMAGLLGDYVYKDSPDAVQDAQEAYKAAVSKEPARFFEHAAFHCSRIEQDIMERTVVYQSSPPLEGLPVCVACGAYSPGMWTLEAAPRLMELLPNSNMEYLPQDKSCWEVEGLEQTLSVASLLMALISDAHSLPHPRRARRGTERKKQDDDRARSQKRRDLSGQYFEDEGSAAVPIIGAAELRLLLDQVVLVDCRSVEERRVSTVPGAMARSTFEEDVNELGRQKIIVAFCTSGDRCVRLVEELLKRPESERTWLDVRFWKGGLLDWCHEGGVLVDHAGVVTTQVVVWNKIVRDLFPVDYTVITEVPKD
mmetsp:Transcript_121081/g.314447  ORF Transcript_121081/g.314447 Transcript_121081/m.314447 type:complete len:551 (-) Transcript_121081:114-1766(-)